MNADVSSSFLITKISISKYSISSSKFIVIFLVLLDQDKQFNENDIMLVSFNANGQDEFLLGFVEKVKSNGGNHTSYVLPFFSIQCFQMFIRFFSIPHASDIQPS